MITWTKQKRITYAVVGVILFLLGWYLRGSLQIPAGAILTGIGAQLVYGQFHLPRLKEARDRLFIRIGWVFFAASMVVAGILFLISPLRRLFYCLLRFDSDGRYLVHSPVQQTGI